MKSKTITRRRFIQGVGLAGVAGTLPANTGPVVARKPSTSSSGKARNIVFLVVDGMGTGTLSLAHHWNLQERGQPLNWIRLYDRPGIVRALQDTASADSPVTDSAAAASSWGCGRRVPNRRINVDAGGREHTPIYTHAKAAGKVTGLVTTCRVTHATPAGFVANVNSRDEEDRIAGQYFEREVDVLLGGGSKHFKTDNRLEKFSEAGYVLAEDLHGLARAVGKQKTRRLLGLFSPDHIPYAIDRANDPAHRKVPGLDAMTRAALNVLGRSPEGFVLQIEGGRVDHAGHANDPAGILREQLEFDAVIRTVVDFQETAPDTLVIVTTDHGTGGCQLDGVGPAYTGSAGALARLSPYRASTGTIATRLRKGVSPADVLTGATGKAPARALRNDIESLVENASGDRWAFENDLAKLIYKDTGIGWTSHNHTAECVELLAFGPGADRIPPFMENHELFELMRSALS